VQVAVRTGRRHELMGPDSNHRGADAHRIANEFGAIRGPRPAFQQVSGLRWS
jgi:hypothetical protein